MSDFFSNLAGRLLGVSEVVRPRLPAMFETPEREVKLAVEETGPAQAPPPWERDGAPESAAPPVANAAPSRPLGFAPEGRWETAAAQRAPETAAFRPPKPAPPAERSSAERPIALEQAETAPTTQVFRERRHDELAPAKRNAEHAATNPQAAQTVQPVTKRGGLPAPGQAAEPVAKRGAPPPPDPRPTPTPAAARSPFAPPPPATRVAARRPEAQPRGGESAIHVSIGRVEIRATSEKQSPRHEKESSPVMSLDDYLRSRVR